MFTQPLVVLFYQGIYNRQWKNSRPVYRFRLPKMLNIRVVPTRAFLALRPPSLSPAFRHQLGPWPRTQALSRGYAERRHTSTSDSADSITASASSKSPPKSWIERTPEKIRPYLYLARVDKPIGTLLLYYPCSTFPSPKTGILGL